MWKVNANEVFPFQYDEKLNSGKKKIAFDPVTFFCEKRDGYSKRERMEIIDLHPKCVFDGWYFL